MPAKSDKNDLTDLAEPILDEASRQLVQKFYGEALPEVLEELPIVKSFVAVGKIYNGIRDYRRTKMLTQFLVALESRQKDFAEFEKLPNDQKADQRGIIVLQLDMQSDERQAEAMAYAIDAYLKNKIHRLNMLGIVSEIKNTNPLLYYFNVDGFTVEDGENGESIAKGSTHLLPTAFGHNTVSGIGRWDSTGEYKFVLTPLGKTFYEFVYLPMSQEYIS